MYNRITNDECCTSAVLLANRLLCAVNLIYFLSVHKTLYYSFLIRNSICCDPIQTLIKVVFLKVTSCSRLKIQFSLEFL